MFIKIKRISVLLIAFAMFLPYFQSRAENGQSSQHIFPFSTPTTLEILITAFTQPNITVDDINQIANDFSMTMISHDKGNNLIEYQWNNRLEITAIIAADKKYVQEIRMVVLGKAIPLDNQIIQINQDLFDFIYERISRIACIINDYQEISNQSFIPYAIWKHTTTDVYIIIEADESGDPFIQGNMYFRFILPKTNDH